MDIITPGLPAFRNRIINGDMRIDQRYAGTGPNTAVNGGAASYTVDRWQTFSGQATKFSFQQNAGSFALPAGFPNYLGLTVVNAYTSGSSASDYFSVDQVIEGLNVSDLGWGTANAQEVTLSFWVRTSVIGTYSVFIQNGAGNRSYVANYSVGSANIWTKISLTIPGDTTGTWATNNTGGIIVAWDLGTGSVYQTTAGVWGAGNYFTTSSAVKWVSNAGATFNLTGVQLEAGGAASAFEHRPYGYELTLCQRYYENNYPYGTARGSSGMTGYTYYLTIATINGYLTGAIPFKVKKRLGSSTTVNFWTYAGVSGWHYGRVGATETVFTPTNVTVGTDNVSWFNSGIATSQDVMYGMWEANAEL